MRMQGATSAIAGLLLLLPCSSFGATASCGQPLSTGTLPVASDALAILQAAVGGADCDQRPCTCDVDGNLTIAASDALRVLKVAVGQPGTLDCSCNASVRCTSLNVSARNSSRLDYGWSGQAHDLEQSSGTLFSADVLRRCANNGARCDRTEDCPGSDCLSTCDCLVDKECEFDGPSQSRRCLLTQEKCNTNADCENSECVHLLGPAQPSSWAGHPVCTVTSIAGSLSGTVNTDTGETTWTGRLRRLTYLGLSNAQPCPRCGAPNQTLEVGEQSLCEGGLNDGAECTVDSVHSQFGGTSYDCPPVPDFDEIGTEGNAMGVVSMTTATASKTAMLPCTDTGLQSHPSRGNGECIDTNSPCTSNADCKRCTGDPSIPCSDSQACGDAGECGEAPLQPVTCGFWCHCGFCDGDTTSPCFSDEECEPGSSCIAADEDDDSQLKPNACDLDQNICGIVDDEECESTLEGRCALATHLVCASDAECAEVDAGDCNTTQLQCFEPRISRTGSSDPVGGHCLDAEGTACLTDGDCGVAGSCVHYSINASTVGLYCAPKDRTPTLAAAAGTTGPAAWTLLSLITFCSCGDLIVGCSEECDDGNEASGDGCDFRCQEE